MVRSFSRITRSLFSSHHCLANSLLNMRLLKRTRLRIVRSPCVRSVMNTPFSTSSIHSRASPIGMLAQSARRMALRPTLAITVRVAFEGDCGGAFLTTFDLVAMAACIARSNTASSSARRMSCASASFAVRRARSMKYLSTSTSRVWSLDVTGDGAGGGSVGGGSLSICGGDGAGSIAGDAGVSGRTTSLTRIELRNSNFIGCTACAKTAFGDAGVIRCDDSGVAFAVSPPAIRFDVFAMFSNVGLSTLMIRCACFSFRKP
mmetsp:Transcript_7283/g.29308  ORF Transcript_7283/g.29308 Transcript_7283/m.29308 type:complete len:261 (-) Transcript_7283:1652-2434(-)